MCARFFSTGGNVNVYLNGQPHKIVFESPSSTASTFSIQMTRIPPTDRQTPNSPTLLFSIMFFFGLSPSPFAIFALAASDGRWSEAAELPKCPGLASSALFAAEIDFPPDVDPSL